MHEASGMFPTLSEVGSWKALTLRTCGCCDVGRETITTQTPHDEGKALIIGNRTDFYSSTSLSRLEKWLESIFSTPDKCFENSHRYRPIIATSSLSLTKERTGEVQALETATTGRRVA